MVDFDLWLTDTEAVREAPRAVQAWNRILDKSVSIAFKKPDGTTLAAQTVRLESDSTKGGVVEISNASGNAPKRQLTVFGVANHPNPDIADTNMAEGYRFVYLKDEYRIIDVLVTLGEVQGVCEAVG